MPSIVHQMTEIYVLVDDFFKHHPALSRRRQSPNDEPGLSDAEVLTIALLQGCFGVQTLKQTWQLVAANHAVAFPRLCSYQQWLARLHALDLQIGALLRATTALPDHRRRLWLIDSKPIPLCHPIRHGRVRLLRDEGAYFGKTSKGWFFGFKLHVLRQWDGRLVNLVLTPGNWDDRDPAPLLALGVEGGLVIGDLGYSGETLRNQLLEEADLLVLTRADAPHQKKLLSQMRQRIETSLSQLWIKFIDRVFSRSWQGLWNTLRLKVLFYNLCHSGAVTC